MVETERPQITICKPFACWITRATDTHPQNINTYSFSTATMVTLTRLIYVSTHITPLGTFYVRRRTARLANSGRTTPRYFGVHFRGLTIRICIKLFFLCKYHAHCMYFLFLPARPNIHTYIHTHTYIYIYIILTIYYDHSYVFRSVSFSKEPIVSAFGGRGWVLKLRQHISP